MCFASNSKGDVEEVATVKVQIEPLTVTIPSAEYFKIENQSAMEIPCEMSPQKSFQLSWFYSNQEVKTGENDYEVRL